MLAYILKCINTKGKNYLNLINLVPTKMNFEIRKPKAEVFIMLFYLCFLAMYKLCL